MEYKKEEIKEYIKDTLKECYEYDKEFLNADIHDIHHDLFNTDYYIIGTYKAKNWLGDKAFDVIGYIKDYETDNFGEVTTDLSSSESVVNMYVYIIGEELLEEVIKEFKGDILLNLMMNPTKNNNNERFELWSDIIGLDRI